jgi:hypothetical protein
MSYSEDSPRLKEIVSRSIQKRIVRYEMRRATTITPPSPIHEKHSSESTRNMNFTTVII